METDIETELRMDSKFVHVGADHRVRVFVDGRWVATCIIELTSKTSVNFDIVRDEPCQVMLQMLDESTIHKVHEEWSARSVSVDLDWTETK